MPMIVDRFAKGLHQAFGMKQVATPRLLGVKIYRDLRKSTIQLSQSHYINLDEYYNDFRQDRKGLHIRYSRERTLSYTK